MWARGINFFLNDSYILLQFPLLFNSQLNHGITMKILLGKKSAGGRQRGACSISAVTFLLHSLVRAPRSRGEDLTFLRGLHKLSIKEIWSWHRRRRGITKIEVPPWNHQFWFSSTFRPFSRCVGDSSLFSLWPSVHLQSFRSRAEISC